MTLIHKIYTALLTMCLLSLQVRAQMPINTQTGYETDANGQRRTSGFENDSIEKEGVPEGIYAWHADARFGEIMSAPYDTVPHLFQNENETMGLHGHYNFTGNLGAPRISRLFREQVSNMQALPFIFTRPYDFIMTGPEQQLYTNTLSPFTNLTYHSCGNKTNGEDRLRALFSVNAGKKLGMGFKADYLYGRGYYEGQSTAHFNGSIFASYIDDKYQMHAYVQHVYLKNRENGGIENDDYVNRPESFPTRYNTSDMPVNLSRAWNKVGENVVYLSHRYNVGFTRFRDAQGNPVERPKPIPSTIDSTLIKTPIDTASIAQRTPGPRIPRQPQKTVEKKTEKLTAQADTARIFEEFVPVSSFIHTFRLSDDSRRFLSNEKNNINNPGFFNDFYFEGDSAKDHTHHFGLENTVALEMHEGFNKWMKMGLILYGKHELAKFDFDLPGHIAAHTRTRFTENYITLGAKLYEHKNRIIQYNVLGEIRTTGTDWGEFNVEGNASLTIPFKRDSMLFHLSGFVRNERPSFYYRHYYGRNIWWDNNDLDKVLHSSVQARLQYRQTALTINLSNIQNALFFQEYLNPYTSSDNMVKYRHSLNVKQASKNVQLLDITLSHNLKAGIFHWDNELTYQATTNKEVMPVPAFNAYSNVYLLFRIARVLRTELGADVRYFTKYYAPVYSPLIGQYAIQDPEYCVKTGNYPIVNAYANFHLKRTRFYVKASHVNFSSGSGNPFLVAHYPLNRLTIHLGVSWNFIN